MKTLLQFALGIIVTVALATPAFAECGDVTDAGCCMENKVKYCENGAVKQIDCLKNGRADDKVCGWMPEFSYYDCGGIGADPSGKNPYLCAGATCTPDCTNKQCGSNKCDGTCGTCTDGKLCNKDFQCENLPDCGGIPYAGCCDGSISKYCKKGFLHVSDCQERPCGWKGDNMGNGVYDCGNKGPDPSKKYPLECSAYSTGSDATTDTAGQDVPATGDTAGIDPGVPTDSGSVGDTTKPPSGGGGGCSAAAVASPFGLVLSLAGILALRRRRD